MADPTIFETRIAASLDDVEQMASGSIYAASSDLELVDDVQTTGGSGQTVGLRFTGVNIPVGAIITKAYIQFQAKEVWTGTTSVSIRGDASANAAAFTTVANNVSSRAQTSASVGWTIASWSTAGAAGVDQRTPDLTSVVQQIVDASGWSALNSMAFVVTGSGTRTAWAYDGNAAAAPLLHIEYTLAAPVVGDISIGDVSITEGDSGTKTATFTVSHTGTAAFSVDYATADGTASAGSDYVAAAGTLNFAQGQTTQTVSVTINGDTAVEPSETFFVNLANASSGGVIIDGQGLGAITNDDAAAVVGDISIGDASISEGDSGTKTLTFTVSRTGTAAFSVGYATANGTATAGSDYVAASGTLNFAQGQTTQTVSVTINGDTAVESNETFFVNLANPTNGGVIIDGQGLGTITNDEAGTTIFETRIAASLDDVEQMASGSIYAASSDLELVDDVQTTGGSGQTVGLRFTGVNIPVGAIITKAYIQFQAKEVWTGTTSVAIRGDASANAAAFTTVANNVSSRAQTAASVGWTIASWSTAGAAGADQRTPDLTSVVQQIVDASGWSALNSMAFVVTGSGTRTAWAYDGNAAAAPLLHIEYTLAAPVVGDISIGDVSITEGDSGTKTATFTVSHTGTAAFSVGYATADGTASAGSDYVAASGTLNFVEGQTTQTVSVTINGDTTIEPSETFFVNLSNASNGGVIIDGQGIGGITNDDAAAVVGDISIGDASIAEGDSGTKTLTFTVSRTGTAAFSVGYATANGTATAGSDYVAASGTLNFAQGQTTQTVSVTINGDTAVESNETFFVNLANPTNGGVIIDGQGLGTITNDEAGTTIFEKRIAASLDDVEQMASGSIYAASSDLELVDDVQTTGGSGQTVGLRFTGVNIPVGAIITKAYIQFQAKEVWTGTTSVAIRGDASANAAAFTTAANNVSSRAQTAASVGWTIAPWSTAGAAGVDQRTPDLTSIVQQVVGASGWSALNSMAFVVTGSGTRTAWAYDGNAAAAPLLHIEYTLAAPVVGDISIGDVSITEGDSGTKTATFTVSHTGTAAFSVGYATADGTASAGSDYVAAAGTLNFAQGQTTQTVSVTINGDTVVEPSETFFVNLANATNGGVIIDGQGLGAITNDDGAGVNHAPTAIALNAPQPVKENVAGAVVGTLSTIDDIGDTHTYTVSDSRFEVVNSQLKLKAGQRLDFERTASVGLNITATDQGGLSVTKGFTVSVGDVAEVRFAAFGDYGDGSGEQAVANLIASMNVDFIVTTGDNLYESVPIDEQIGRYYSNYIGNYVGAYGAGSAINRFFPTVGNHEYEDPAGGANAIKYYNYFTLPDNERYYDYQMGSIHFFSLNSDYEPDGYKYPSIQASWLQSGLAASDSPFNLVLSHYPPYSSGVEHGSQTNMQWPFENWGATAVLNGHDHDYERILRDDNGDGATMPYFVTGLGGSGKYGLGTTVSGSQVFYNADYGTMLVQASDATITFEFWSIANGGQLIDSYTIDRQGADALMADGDDTLNGSSSSDYMNGLSGADRLEGKGGNDMLIGGQGSDTFVFKPGFGRDTIADFVVEGSSHDFIEFSTAVFADWNALRAAITDSVQGAVITLDANNTITLANVTKAQLVANNGDDFLFL